MAKAQMKEFKVTEHHSGRNPKVNIFKAFTKHAAVKKAMNQDKNFDKLKSVEVEVHKPTRVEKFSKKSVPKKVAKKETEVHVTKLHADKATTHHVVKTAQASEKQFNANHPKVVKFIKSNLVKKDGERVATVDAFDKFLAQHKTIKMELPEFNHHLRTENLEVKKAKALVGSDTELSECSRLYKRRNVTRVFDYKLK